MKWIVGDKNCLGDTPFAARISELEQERNEMLCQISELKVDNVGLRALLAQAGITRYRLLVGQAAMCLRHNIIVQSKSLMDDLEKKQFAKNAPKWSGQVSVKNLYDWACINKAGMKTRMEEMFDAIRPIAQKEDYDDIAKFVDEEVEDACTQRNSHGHPIAKADGKTPITTHAELVEELQNADPSEPASLIVRMLEVLKVCPVVFDDHKQPGSEFKK
jgi:hypothetical protein